jgi:16S rRNA (uracil1498-N3)-methyltransferase
MPRFYCPNLPVSAASLRELSANPDAGRLVGLVAHLDRDEAHHARRVLRLELGEAIELFDGQGLTAAGALESWTNGASIRLHRVEHHEPPKPALTIAAAVPKGDRAEDMVNQLSQLGVTRFVPLRTARGVVDPRPRKLDKFERIAIESAKQCGRAHLMEIREQADLATLMRDQHDLRLIASPGSAKSDDLTARIRRASRVLVLVGPEGGWTDDELAAAKQAGCEPWQLGPHVLRIETAATAAAAILRHITS